MRALLMLLITTPAWADPCVAPLPTQAGQTFEGHVSYIIDGDSICVGTLPNAIEVRLYSVQSPELWTQAGKIAKSQRYSWLHKQVTCTVTPWRGHTTTYDRVSADCHLRSEK